MQVLNSVEQILVLVALVYIIQLSYQTCNSLEEVKSFSVFPVMLYKPQVNLLKTSKNADSTYIRCNKGSWI